MQICAMPSVCPPFPVQDPSGKSASAFWLCRQRASALFQHSARTIKRQANRMIDFLSVF